MTARSDGETAHSLVICEGYHDRAFWAGLLGHVGFSDPSDGGQRTVHAWGKQVRGGRFAFDSPGGHRLLVIPARGFRGDVGRAAHAFLKRCQIEPIRHVVLCVDDDSLAPDDDRAEPPKAREPAQDWFRTLVRTKTDGGSITGEGRAILPQGENLHLVVWKTDDPPAPGLPAFQTLERVVCAALVETHGDAVESVARFLADAGHVGRPAVCKGHAWSFMARLWPESGCDDFYRQVWRDAAVAEALERRLPRAMSVAKRIATERA